MSLSCIVMAKNEQKNIKQCLESIAFADEIVLVDDFSTDQTVEIAKTLGAKVFQHGMNGDWASQYNFGMSKATSQWILFIDADERVTPKLQAEIIQVISSNESYGYKISWLNFAVGRPLYYGGWRSHSGLRLFMRGSVTYEGLVHPNIIHKLQLRKLKQPMLHYSYPTWEHYFGKFNSYTQLAAQENNKKGKRANFFGDVLLRPFFAFFKMYILRSGWRDGKIGFIMAVFHFFYTMTKYVKLYYMQNAVEDQK